MEVGFAFAPTSKVARCGDDDCSRWDEHGLSGCNGAGAKVPGSGSAFVLVDDAAEDIVAADRPTMAGL
jgi:hypothetical protein